MKVFLSETRHFADQKAGVNSRFVLGLFLGLALVLPIAFSPRAHARAPILGVLDRSSKQDFDSKILPLLKEQLKRCSQCEIRNLTTYDEKGFAVVRPLSPDLAQKIHDLDLMVVTWNEKMGDSHRTLVDALAAATSRGLVVVGEAGWPEADQPAGPLRKTVLGQIPEALIIGERNERDRLVGVGYFGPEMLTAIRPPKELMGQRVSGLLFAARMTQRFADLGEKRSSAEVVSAIKKKKLSSRKLWLDLEDFFPR